MNTDLTSEAKVKALKWLEEPINIETKNILQDLISNNPEELEESFYTDLEFGTGGMRGLMGVGTNRINEYTLGMATQGLCNYLKKVYPNNLEKSVAIAHDSRNNSAFFARRTAEVFAANGIKAYLFEALRPTPELSFAVRHLNCQSGIVITASHNPKEYNGYKVYWDDGGQIVSPHDTEIIKEVRNIASIGEIKTDFDPLLVQRIGTNVDEAYLSKLSELVLSPEAIAAQKDIKIVYTSLHGSGITLIPKALKRAGFANVAIVEEQEQPDGDFPTVESPNPEEASALQMAIDLSDRINAELVLGTDPDTDRVGIAVRDEEGKMVLLNGNETGALLVYYHLLRWNQLNKLDGTQFVGKTIVTTTLIDRICKGFGVKCYDTLTGFKHIARLIRDKEPHERFLVGGEESFGYLVGDFVRDKDAVIAAQMICEIAAWCMQNGKSMYTLLQEIHEEFGAQKEALISITKKGKAGKEEIDQMMIDMRLNAPENIAGYKVVEVWDYKLGQSVNLTTKNTQEISLPKSDVLQFVLSDGSKITARPSGTEPKIKFYISVFEQVENQSYEKVMRGLDIKIENFKKELGVG